MMQTRNLGLALIIVGAFFVSGAGFAYTYAQAHSINAAGIKIPLPSTYPYRDDSFGLILGGVALFVVGFALMIYRPQNKPDVKTLPAPL